MSDDLAKYLSTTRAASFIESFDESDGTLYVNYFKDYESYHRARPESKLTEEQVKTYFKTQDSMEKMFLRESVALLRRYPTLDRVVLTLPITGTTHVADVRRSEIEEHLNLRLDELTDEQWRQDFVDRILYDDAARDRFVERFITDRVAS